MAAVGQSGHPLDSRHRCSCASVRQGTHAGSRIFFAALGVLVFGAAHWLQSSNAYGQTNFASKDKLMERECYLAPREILSLVEDQLAKSSSTGGLASEVQEALIPVLTGCRTDPAAMLDEARKSEFFNSEKSSKDGNRDLIRIVFSKTEDEFSFAFNICSAIFETKTIKCKKNQIRSVSSYYDVHRWP